MEEINKEIKDENITGIDNYSPTELEVLTIDDVTQADIIEAIKASLKVSPLINPSKVLVNSVYSILKGLFIDDKKYVILEAPTGSGKTIIGFISYFCIQYLFYKKNMPDTYLDADRLNPVPQLGYFLTSAKMLQEQIDSDLDRFDFRNYITMLKGVANYDCILETDKLKPPYPKDRNGLEIKRVSYSDRPCKGLTKKERMQAYSECDPICPYQVARFEASEKSFTVFNYAYFLNVMRGEFNPFFGPRLLTIADEAHLVPDIVCNIFNFEFTQFLFNRTSSIVQEMDVSYGTSEETDQAKKLLSEGFLIFRSMLNRLSTIESYFNICRDLKNLFSTVKKIEQYKGLSTKVGDLVERFENILKTEDQFKNLTKRPEDAFFESELIANDRVTNSKVYKHIVRDLSEGAMVKEHFLKKTNKVILMSATIGDIDEYASLMGMEDGEYLGLKLPSQFDFSKSPINLCKSGWLNYKNFDNNIDKVLLDTIKICNDYHPKEKGIIHTSTFKICNLIKDKINQGLVQNPDRFLFYANADEKEAMVNMMKESSKPYVIVGPSLYEGLDLKDDLGRFGILVKVPYGGLTDYTKRKIERFPFWYRRTTIQKVEQAIGRTNRHVNDYSTIYLMDSSFDKIIFETNESIVDRITYLKI